MFFFSDFLRLTLSRIVGVFSSTIVLSVRCCGRVRAWEGGAPRLWVGGWGCEGAPGGSVPGILRIFQEFPRNFLEFPKMLSEFPRNFWENPLPRSSPKLPKLPSKPRKLPEAELIPPVLPHTLPLSLSLSLSLCLSFCHLSFLFCIRLLDYIQHNTLPLPPSSPPPSSLYTLHFSNSGQTPMYRFASSFRRSCDACRVHARKLHIVQRRNSASIHMTVSDSMCALLCRALSARFRYLLHSLAPVNLYKEVSLACSLMGKPLDVSIYVEVSRGLHACG